MIKKITSSRFKSFKNPPFIVVAVDKKKFVIFMPSSWHGIELNYSCGRRKAKNKKYLVAKVKYHQYLEKMNNQYLCTKAYTES